MSKRSFSRATFLTPFLALLALLVVACGGTTAPPTTNEQIAPPAKQVLRYPIGATDFGTLDPALATLNTDIFTIQLIFGGMVEAKSDGIAIDTMAASHSVSADGLTYTFKLKPNLKFSDGTPLTAQDIIWSIDRSLAPATKSPLSGDMEPVKDSDKMIAGKIKTLIGDSLIAKDDQTVVIVLSHPAAYFIQTFTSTNAFTINKKLVEKYGNQWTDHLQEGAGSGPFMVQNYDHNKGLTLVPNPYYYGPKPKLQKIEMLRSGPPDTAYKTYMAGQLDLITSVPTINLENARTRKDFKSVPELYIRYVDMNYQSKPFDNIKIRQAFALAVNKDLISQNVMHGAVKPTNHLMPEGMTVYNPKLTGPEGVASTKGDAAKAKQLLQEGMKEEGYASVSQLPRISFTYYSNDTDVANTAAVLVQQWQTVLGVTVHAQAVSIDILVQQMTDTTGHDGPLQLWIIGFGNYPDPYGWISDNFGKDGSFNNHNYGQNQSKTAAAQQAVQEELRQADMNLNPQERIQQYSDAEQKIVNDAGWIPLFQRQVQMLISPKLKNFPLSPVNLIEPDAWSNIYFVQ
ncbi:peptide ABC transporter substrate-binding protein [Ktedonosporobacter rubrisoli]|uniref:Peptide ABC transporter substrate-binding protein n=1 Tax=Ktedonosporobacter rubrisoli TaxID=2509675 RepID=A0A4P6JYX2_KTERU|nr:peptide ABC transporter substrate-binding protein [Ktedonosporobacter rubrisoli]QBD80775.1 peptide ABC transporter substrate-binding protein [Ktedonosporobacter rubrisoli]